MMTLQIINHNVHKVLIDTESSMNVLFRSAYDQMGLPPTILKPVDTPLYGFFSHGIQPHGRMEFPVTVGSHPAKATVMSNFLIMDTPITISLGD